MRNNFPYCLYLVISEDSCPGKNFINVAKQAIEGGVDIIQLREKGIDTAHFLEKALRLQDMLSKHQIPLIINDNLDVAMQCSAFGIHVGSSDISPMRIRSTWKDCHSLGYSIEYLEQLENDNTKASDCLGISPVFQTATKKNTVTEWGIMGIKKLRELTDKPLIAIGNMNEENAFEVIKAGADCIAVVSAICRADSPANAAAKIKDQIIKAL